jgi:hypothetical protein
LGGGDYFTSMNIKHPAIVAGTLLLLPVLAHAEPASDALSSTLQNLFWGSFPFVTLGLMFYWFLRKWQNPRVKKYDEHMARTVQHMEHVEQSLDRIAYLLEEQDKRGR